MKKVFKIILDIIITLVIICSFIITTLTLITNKDGIPSLFGYSPFTIQTNSMAPTFKSGDLIVSKKDDIHKVKLNDIVSFYSMEQGSMIIKTHRVINISNENGIVLLTTKGDNNQINDDVLVPAEDFIGIYKEIKIPVLGKIIDFLKSKWGFFFCILIPLVLLFGYAIYDLFKVLIEESVIKIKTSQED